MLSNKTEPLNRDHIAITEKIEETEPVTFRNETEGKLWLHTFTFYLGNINATQFADKAVLQYRARLPKIETDGE